MGGDIAIRDFSEADYPLLAAVDAAAHDDHPRAIELWEHADANRDSKLFFRRNVIEVDRVPVACGTFGHSEWIDDPDKYWFQILVPRDRDGDAIRLRYLGQAIEILSARAPRALYTGMVESYTDHIRFLVDNGFSEVHREHVSRLDLGSFDPDQYRAAIDRVVDDGIELVPLRSLIAMADAWQTHLHPIYQQLVLDQPAPDPPRLDTLEEWQTSVLDSPDFDPDLWIVALDGDQIIGFSQAQADPGASTVLDCGLTGVLSTYRRRGIATALKVEMLTAAKSQGAEWVSTTNEESNPMYRINLGLGFVPRPDWIMFELSGVWRT